MLPFYFLPAALLTSAAATPLFGAIAVDMDDSSVEPAYGWSNNQPDQASAERVALSYCREYAGENSGCRAIVWFKGCGAYANSNTTYGYGYGKDESEAKSKAAEMCSADGVSCTMLVSVCNDRPETE